MTAPDTEFVPAPYIGPDEVVALHRTATGAVGADGRPILEDREVPVGNASVTVATTFERRDTGSVAVYNAKIALPVTADTRTLTADDAIRFGDLTFELQADPTVRTTLAGADDHVRAFGLVEVPVGTRRERVVVIPKGGRDDLGAWRPDGDPVVLLARGVTPGATTRTLDGDGTLDKIEFTVALDADAPVKDGDEMTVRGVTGWCRVVRDDEPYANASELVVTVSSRMGGRT